MEYSTIFSKCPHARLGCDGSCAASNAAYARAAAVASVRRRLLTAVSALLLTTAAILASSSSHADVVFRIVTPDGDTSAEIMQGQELEIVSEIAANDPGDTVGAVVCNVESPAGWEILDRRYEEYGWFQADGTWDHSVLSALGDPAIPGVPGNDPWPSTVVADFRLETIRADFADLPAGVQILETIQIAVPADTLPGFYSFGFGYLEASNIAGSLDLVETADTFTLTVIPVPEPSTALLVLATTSLLMIPARKGHRRHPPIFH